MDASKLAMPAAAQPPLRTFSFGGGWQSVAAMVLAARGDLDFTEFVFANVGDDSEHPATLAYIAAHVRPFAREHGLALHELVRRRRDGSIETLFAQAVGLEATLNARRSFLGRDPVWLTRYNTPLDRVVADEPVLPFEDGDGGCDSGWCFT